MPMTVLLHYLFQWYGHCDQHFYSAVDCGGGSVHFLFILHVFCCRSEKWFRQIFYAILGRIHLNCFASILSQWRYWIQDRFSPKWIFKCFKKCTLFEMNWLYFVVLYMKVYHKWSFLNWNTKENLQKHLQFQTMWGLSS